MNGWKVEAGPGAKKEFRNLPERVQDEAQQIFEELEDGPAISGALELKRNPNLWRIHLAHGPYRMVYEVSNKKRQIRIVRIRPRGVAYKGLKGP